jgi:hypothetical protein
MPDAVAGSKVKPRYSPSGFVVLDEVTGLGWEQYPDDVYEGCTGNNTRPGDGCTWEEAKAYCDGFVLGSSDWRLPTKIELESLLDDTQAGAKINAEAFPTAPAASFWTASALAGAPTVWYVSFANGMTFGQNPTAAMRVRCVRTVRRPTASSASRYTVNPATVPVSVADNRTGLVWQQAISASTHTFASAKTACTMLGSGWRLPTKKELLTLVDPTVPLGTAVPAIDPIAFPNTPPEAFLWSSSPLAGSADSAWGVQVTGIAVNRPDTSLYNVRCVR